MDSTKHDVDNAREDLKQFVNDKSSKGFRLDVFLCVLYEAVLVFEDMVKENLKKTGNDKKLGMEIDVDMKYHLSVVLRR